MPRIRAIKPEYFKDEEIAELSPLTRLLYIGLWCYADKAGRLEYRPNYFKIEILPYDNLEISKEIEALCSPKKRTGIPFILKYEVDGISYLQIIQWNKHQYLHKTNESDSVLPEPPTTALQLISNGRTTIEQRMKDGMTTAYEGRERKGREGKGRECGASPQYLPECSGVIVYLNRVCKSHFEPENKSWLGIVHARMKEGYTLEDFYAVVDEKFRQWGQDEKMVHYLKPGTLFTANHMEAYLSEANRQAKRGKK